MALKRTISYNVYNSYLNLNIYTGVAVQAIESGGLYINYCQTKVADFVLTHGQHILPNNTTLIRIGKRANSCFLSECS